ncbi:MAG: hypothetical protein ACRDHD_04985 [Candidatus Limnocylindria bacterium]
MEQSSVNRRPAFLVECFAPASEDALTAAAVGEACAELRAAGVEITYLGALFVPDDELAFHVFAAPDAGSVIEAGRRAGLRIERVVPALALGFNEARAAARLSLPVAVEAERPVAHAPGEIGP